MTTAVWFNSVTTSGTADAAPKRKKEKALCTSITKHYVSSKLGMFGSPS